MTMIMLCGPMGRKAKASYCLSPTSFHCVKVLAEAYVWPPRDGLQRSVDGREPCVDDDRLLVRRGHPHTLLSRFGSSDCVAELRQFPHGLTSAMAGTLESKTGTPGRSASAPGPSTADNVNRALAGQLLRQPGIPLPKKGGAAQ
jgi:hypothetical protein